MRLRAVGTVLALLLGCGTRTGLSGEGFIGAQGGPARPPPGNGVDGRPQGGREADAGAASEGPLPRDSSLPPLQVPEPSGKPRPVGCTEESASRVFVVTEQQELHRFYPQYRSFERVGEVRCPTSRGTTPFSMAVDRFGTGYVLFQPEREGEGGRLFRVSTATAACTPVPLRREAPGFDRFGMGFVADEGLGRDVLYVAGNPGPTGARESEGLAAIDGTTMTLKWVGAYDRAVGRAELTGSSDGRLFAFYLDPDEASATLAEVDPKTARLLGADHLELPAAPKAFAFAYWGQEFWIFASEKSGGASTIYRYSPLQRAFSPVGSFPSTIVGAGVAPCAP